MITIEQLESVIAQKREELTQAILMGGDPAGVYTLQQLQSNIIFLSDYLTRLKVSQSQ